jgi:hypothetical protein
VIDPHTHEYMVRLRDEPVFLALAQKVSEYCTRIGNMKDLARVSQQATADLSLAPPVRNAQQWSQHRCPQLLDLFRQPIGMMASRFQLM